MTRIRSRPAAAHPPKTTASTSLSPARRVLGLQLEHQILSPRSTLQCYPYRNPCEHVILECPVSDFDTHSRAMGSRQSVDPVGDRRRTRWRLIVARGAVRGVDRLRV